MNKTELVERVSQKTGLTKKDTTTITDSILETIIDELNNGEKVKLVGFGNFEIRNRAERKARNMHTGDEIIVPPSKTPAFKPSKTFKESVNNS